MACLEKCTDCIFPYLNGCPCGHSLHNAACLTLSEPIFQCSDSKCKQCKHFIACNGKLAEMNRNLKI